MAKKFNILDHIPAFDEAIKCDRCEAVGSRQYDDGNFCGQCACNDVFEQMNENRD